LDIRRLHAQRTFVGMHGIDEKSRDLMHAPAALDSAADDLVIDVGDVAHVFDLVAADPQPALDDIKTHEHARMPQVAEIVHGHPAYVHADHARVDRPERLFAA